MNLIIEKIAGFIWGPYFLIPLLIGTGIYLTLKLKFIQFLKIKEAILITSGKYDDKNNPGEISHFKALMTALSATIGTGNIVGVAAAILLGGPGAVFWMWITAILGMATKYSSCFLAVKFRTVDKSGEVHSGPMYFILKGMGEKFKWLAYAFALFTIIASFGIGNMFQINNIVSSLHLLLFKTGHTSSFSFNIIVGIAVAGLTAMVILGGIKRIAAFTSYLVPFMCLLYIFGGLYILIHNSHLIISGLKLIFSQAFQSSDAISGGLVGGVIRHGVARGLFSNEAGLGSAPIAHGAAKTDKPVREGLVAMLGPLIDTLIICSITALVIVSTGAYQTCKVKGQLTAFAFETGIPGSGWIVAMGIILFAFSTIISWSYYGDRAFDFIFGKNSVKLYKYIYLVFIILGACLKIDVVINLCDAMNGLMALPNLIALLVLSPLILKETTNYFNPLTKNK